MKVIFLRMAYTVYDYGYLENAVPVIHMLSTVDFLAERVRSVRTLSAVVLLPEIPLGLKDSFDSTLLDNI